LPNGVAAHADPHGHPHHPALQHHFETLEQQQEAATLGMWVFLVTEVMFFGGLLMAYLLYRVWYPEAWSEGSLELDIVLGGINTVVLIASSLTMALAVRSAQTGAQRPTFYWLLITMAVFRVRPLATWWTAPSGRRQSSARATRTTSSNRS